MQTAINILTLLVTPADSWTFLSMQFFVLFVLFCTFYAVISRLHVNYRHLYVIAFSLFFAYKGGGMWLILPVMAVLSWLLTRMMSVSRHRKAICIFTVFVELLPLLMFRAVPTIHAIIPIGVAFYSLQAVSYTVDVYRRRFPANTTFLRYAFYITYFPLLIAGPITRASVLTGDESEQEKDESTSPLYHIIIVIILFTIYFFYYNV